MKKILRMLIFSALALFFTSLWNKGFIISYDIYSFLISVVLISVIYYLLSPLFKLVLLPLNLISFGIASFCCILFLLHILSYGFHLFSIIPWIFNEMNIFSFVIPTIKISYLLNLILSSISISGIINMLERFV